VVLNIWASWCVPCQQEAPTLERSWREQARPHGVLFLGLDMQDVTTDAQSFMRHYAVDYPNIRDPTNDVARAYGATGVPETFFINARGRIVGHVIGVSSTQQLSAGIAAALSGQVHGARRGGEQRPLQ
jgi:cytochrome c biogenesis protein CcmG/thiol:disulfide interchange protein DsbE